MQNHYRAFNLALSRQLQNEVQLRKVKAPASFDRNTETGRGTLIVQVTLAKEAIPVEDAEVTVSSADGQTVLAVMRTDQSGQTAPLSLSAPSADRSQSPEDTAPYGLYRIRVHCDGYRTEIAEQVPIFDRITSIQPIALLPLGETDSAEPVVFRESEPDFL